MPLVPFTLFRSRNFTLMNWVSGTLSIGMLGIFLPFTIYLQSALGFSAIKAGLTMAPSSLVMIAAAPFLGKLTDKTGGKYILITGLSLFAVLNTTRQVGSVIGTAAVGAMLQNRLVAALTSEATIKSAALPASARAQFVNGFRQSAASGMLSGGPSGSAPGSAAGGSTALAALLHRLGAEVFSTGYGP